MMPETDFAMTWEEKVDYWAVTLLAPAVVLWVAVAATGRPGAAGRYAGAVLELLGFGIAAYGLQEKLAQVTDRPGLRERLRKWVTRVWRRIKMTFGWKPDPVTLSPEGLSVGHEVVSARLTQKAGPGASVDDRVEVLEQEMERIRGWIKDIQQECRDGRAELKGEIDDVRSDLGDVEDEMEDFVRRLAIGSLHWEATGLFWFALGVVVSTWPGTIPGG